LVEALGIDRAREQARILAEQAAAHLDVFDRKRSEPLRKVAEYVISRKS
jgi:farnesyl diphosphate synthase